jgi:hypothetical protein
MSVHRDHDIAHLPENEVLGVTLASPEGKAGFVIYFLPQTSDGCVRGNRYARRTGLALNTVPDLDFGHVTERVSNYLMVT